MTVALENVHLPTTWQVELMFRNNGLLHHDVINCCRPTTVLSAMLANNFSTSMCFAILELIKFMHFASTLSYPLKEFVNPRPLRSKFNLPRTQRRFLYLPHKCGYPQPTQDSNTYRQSSDLSF